MAEVSFTWLLPGSDLIHHCDGLCVDIVVGLPSFSQRTLVRTFMSIAVLNLAMCLRCDGGQCLDMEEHEVLASEAWMAE